MNDDGWSLAGWPAVPVFVMLAVTPALTALVISLPIAWLVNHIFAASAIHAIFGVQRLGYWRTVGLFAMLSAAQFKIKFHASSK